MEFPNFDEFSRLKNLCQMVAIDGYDKCSLKKIKDIIAESDRSFVNVAHIPVLSATYGIIKRISEDKNSFSNAYKQLVIDTLTELFRKFKLKRQGVFFNIYSFLLFEIYDHNKHLVLPINEEYKLSILQCMTNLASSASSDLVFDIYKKENAGKFSLMLYVALEIANKEQMRQLRITAIECILSIAKVLDDDDFNDVVMREQVANVFMYFLPRIASGLKNIALEDEKVGHKIPMIAIQAWGKLVTLLMAHYGAPDEDLHTNKKQQNDGPLKTENDVKSYIESTARTSTWYKENDQKLEVLVVEFLKLVHHSHHKVRLALLQTCQLLIEHCYRNIPSTIGHLVEIVINLSTDENDEIASAGKATLKSLSRKFTSVQFKVLLENLEDGFLAAIGRLPRTFNGIDEKEQLSAVNLLIGYVHLFGDLKINDVLLSNIHLNKLMNTMIHVSEIERKNVGLLEEYTFEDVDSNHDSRTPWKNFRYFKDDRITNQLEELCRLLAQYGAFNTVSDFLLDEFLYTPEHRKEAIFLLNALLMGSENADEHHTVLKNIVMLYTGNSYWNIPIQVCVDDYGREYTLSEVQNNVLTVCLLMEGIGKIALVSKTGFKRFLLRTLYIVFQKAGCGNPLIKISGLSALKNVAISCDYQNITELIIKNIDYFSYYVERNLYRVEDSDAALNVMTIILKYSNIHVLPHTSEIINQILIQSCDKYKEINATAYLRVFNIFIQSLLQWFDVQPTVLPIKSKTERDLETPDFYVSGVSQTDDISDKSPEEMYKEDMERKQEELLKDVEEPPDEEYKKPKAPLHVKLTVDILSRSLHFLPSKDRSRKLLVLKILTNGLEIIKEWEDELLPIVHQIWSPLVGRFKEYGDPLIINYSFELLVTLARLSKEFIRMRTQTDVLPSIIHILGELSKDSYLKDKGSAYRYKQSYKMQLVILDKLARLLIDLDVLEKHLVEAMDCIFVYLSDKQPKPLQENAIEFYATLTKYDPEIVKKHVKQLIEKHKGDEFNKNLNNLCI